MISLRVSARLEFLTECPSEFQYFHSNLLNHRRDLPASSISVYFNAIENERDKFISVSNNYVPLNSRINGAA